MIPNVQLEDGKVALFCEILGVNDLQDIDLLHKFRNIFVNSQYSGYENDYLSDVTIDNRIGNS